MSKDLAPLDDLSPAAAQLELDPRAFSYAPLRALAQDGSLTAVSLDMTRGGHAEWSFESYMKLGFYLGLTNRSIQWWVGDWLLYGEASYGERFSQAMEVTGLALSTLQNRMSICKLVPPSMRRPSLGFSTHAEVAGLGAREQRRWLDRAEQGNWTRAQLRDAMKASGSQQQQLGGTDGGGRIDRELLVEAAQAVASSRREMGDSWLVSRESMARLIAALGEEE